jgi:hypothetical protein
MQPSSPARAATPVTEVVSPLERLRRFAVRFWPHLCAFVLGAIWSVAERETWHESLDRPFTASVTGWWSSRLTAPIEVLSVNGETGGIMLAVLSPLILLHIIFPRWYFAPLSLMATFTWFLWGTIALGQLGIRVVA